MKKAIILFVSVLCFFSVKISFSQTVWQQLNPKLPDVKLYDVYFIDEFHGWAVGNNGVIIHTEDGGVKWNRQYSYYSGNDFDCIFFVNEDIGFIAGNEVYKTENGGEDWVLNYTGNFSINSIFFIDELTGWMGGEQEKLYKTENGGEDWLPQNDTGFSCRRIKKIFFLDENTGWIILRYNEVLKTTNGGEEWIMSELGGLSNLNDIFFINETTGWIGANNGILLKSIDGGVSWDTVQMNFNGDIFKVRFFDENSGRVATEQYCYITNNGGSSWQEVELSCSNINAAAFPNENFGCAVGDYNICYSTDGGYSWTNTYSGFTYDLNSLCLAAENKLYAVGNSGAIIFSNDGGENWSEQNSNTYEDLNEVVFTNENTGWIVGLFGKLLYTNNSGDDWITKEINTSYILYGITFINPETGWIAGDNGFIFKTTDGGNNWTEINTGIYKRFYDVCFVDQNIGWVVGTEGTIVHTTDGGNTWILQETPCDNNLYAISFINQNKGWIAGGQVILTTTNGGEDWTIQLSPEYADYFKSISFTDSLNGWVCGPNEALFHTIDGGLHWVNQNGGIINNTNLNCLVFTDSLHGYLTGENGTVMYTDCGTYLAPFIIEQPIDTIVCAGTDISLQIDAIGNSLNYQWLKSNYMISGGTFNYLTFNPITAYDGGYYNCYVFNEGGLAESDVFTVIVMTPPEITGHPIDITANINTYIAFNLAVTGTLPLSYQWQKNGVDIPGGNFHIYPIESVQLSDTGYYRCRIFNECDTVYTEEAKLTVIDNAGINDFNINQYVNIFPNPATDKISVKFKKIFFGEPVQISVYNLLGRKVYETIFKADYENDVCKINCKDFTKGVYFIEVRNENKAMVMKIVKN